MLRVPQIATAVMAAVLCLTTAVAGQKKSRAPVMGSKVTLGEWKDRARPLLIFAPGAHDMRMQDQMTVVQAHQKEAKDRDLIAIAVPESGEISVGRMLGPEEAAKARRRFHVEAGEFAVVLVGKDGGEKLRSAKPLPFKRLQDAIDSMPMRQEEKARGAH